MGLSAEWDEDGQLETTKSANALASTLVSCAAAWLMLVASNCMRFLGQRCLASRRVVYGASLRLAILCPVMVLSDSCLQHPLRGHLGSLHLEQSARHLDECVLLDVGLVVAVLARGCVVTGLSRAFGLLVVDHVVLSYGVLLWI